MRQKRSERESMKQKNEDERDNEMGARIKLKKE